MQDVQCWNEAIEAWERDPVNTINPFEMTVAHTYSLGFYFWFEGSHYLL